MYKSTPHFSSQNLVFFRYLVYKSTQKFNEVMDRQISYIRISFSHFQSKILGRTLICFAFTDATFIEKDWKLPHVVLDIFHTSHLSQADNILPAIYFMIIVDWRQKFEIKTIYFRCFPKYYRTDIYTVFTTKYLHIKHIPVTILTAYIVSQNKKLSKCPKFRMMPCGLSFI